MIYSDCWYTNIMDFDGPISAGIREKSPVWAGKAPLCRRGASLLFSGKVQVVEGLLAEIMADLGL